MDAELHRVPDAVGEIQEVLLLVHIAGVDVPRHDVRSLLDPQQLRL
jgi:predicted xylose isomerase-like sugar epimerase